jgi:peptidoglycan-associated lipoprotein
MANAVRDAVRPRPTIRLVKTPQVRRTDRSLQSSPHRRPANGRGISRALSTRMHHRTGLSTEHTLRFLVSMILALASGCGAATTSETRSSTTPSKTSRPSADTTRANAGSAATDSCAVGSIYFGVDSATLDDASRTQLICIPRASEQVNLVGMTDPRGTDEYNLALGERRARSVAEHLQRLGYEARRIETRSLGEEVATGDTELEWAHDRRVNFAAQ